MGRPKSRRIAVCGKGGAGKTSLSALLVRNLALRNDRKILAVDADPATGLATALNVTVGKTVNDIRNSLIERAQKGEKLSSKETARLIDYELLDALAEEPGFAFLAIGRPETEGCFCKVNDLLKDVISSLAGNFDIVIIDGEAGVEQVNRRVMKKVDDLLLVSDASAKSLNVAETIHSLAVEQQAVAFRRSGLIINRARSEAEAQRASAGRPMELLGWIPEDETVRSYDIEGISFMELPDDSPVVLNANRIIQILGL